MVVGGVGVGGCIAACCGHEESLGCEVEMWLYDSRIGPNGRLGGFDFFVVGRS